ncbi:MAG: chemotaxis response regulator protein-glutamate methylesterase [Spirochaetaceae bacterium]|nr:chemotaxis response regulator protein-glutamate methylesterase [Spirochaetaceae bacterium]
MDTISVLIVDDSALMRNLVGRIIERTPGLRIADKAMNGEFALAKIPLCNPDVIVLDIEMPVMNGIEFLKERRRRGIDIPVIMLSSIAKEGSRVTMECLELGAADFVTKPSGSDSPDIVSVAERLTELLIGYGTKYASKKLKRPVFIPEPAFITEQSKSSSLLSRASSALNESTQKQPSDLSAAPRAVPSFGLSAKKETGGPVVPIREGGKIEIIAIGISTGGPNALREVFKDIDPNLEQPILVVQHMPAGFTEEFANSLNNICPLEVKEAKEGDVVKKGRILIAPGNKHILVERRPLATVVHLSDAEQRNGHRPSADVLFESVAQQYQNRALGVIMTGMGRDGAAQITEMRRQGSYTLGQDEESSIVYGMPKVAFEMGGIQKQVALKDMANEINKVAREHA